MQQQHGGAGILPLQQQQPQPFGNILQQQQPQPLRNMENMMGMATSQFQQQGGTGGRNILPMMFAMLNNTAMALGSSEYSQGR